NTNRGGLSRVHIYLIVRRGFSSGLPGVDRAVMSMDNVVVDPVFDVRTGVERAEEPLVVGLILGEQQSGITLAIQIPLSNIRVRCCHRLSAILTRDLFQ